ncbi:MAG: hypothetical protein ABGZ24_16895, partial [Fuerstiella sp.]
AFASFDDRNRIDEVLLENSRSESIRRPEVANGVGSEFNSSANKGPTASVRAVAHVIRRRRVRHDRNNS